MVRMSSHAITTYDRLVTASIDQSDPLGYRGSSLVDITPLTCMEGNESGTPSAFPNMNPALNNVTSQTPGNVQVLNVLDVPQASNTLEQFAMADVGLLEGIPGGMFDWGVYDSMHCRETILMCHRAMGLVLCAVQRIERRSGEGGRRWYFWWDGQRGTIASRGDVRLDGCHMYKRVISYTDC